MQYDLRVLTYLSASSKIIFSSLWLGNLTHLLRWPDKFVDSVCYLYKVFFQVGLKSSFFHSSNSLMLVCSQHL